MIKLKGQSQIAAVKGYGHRASAEPARRAIGRAVLMPFRYAVPCRSRRRAWIRSVGELLCERWATWPLARLIEPAIALARDGFGIGARLARLSSELAATCSEHRGWRDTYLVNGHALPEGGLLKQERLANALSLIARDGPQSFYRGPIADDIVHTISMAESN